MFTIDLIFTFFCVQNYCIFIAIHYFPFTIFHTSTLACFFPRKGQLLVFSPLWFWLFMPCVNGQADIYLSPSDFILLNMTPSIYIHVCGFYMELGTWLLFSFIELIGNGNPIIKIFLVQNWKNIIFKMHWLLKIGQLAN